METILSLAFRKNEDGYYFVQIREQIHKQLSFHSDELDYSLVCSGQPEVNGSRFYLRGVSESQDWTWTRFHLKYVEKVCAILKEFSRHENYNIKYSLSGDIQELLVNITNESYNGCSLDVFIAHFDIIGPSPKEDFREAKTCFVCNETSKKVKPEYFSNGNRKLICDKCIDVYTKCKGCGYHYEKMNAVVNSLGETTKVCKNCVNYFNCNKCGFEELLLHKKTLRFIDDDGQTKKNTVCLKCVQKKTECGGCGYNFEGKRCPCSLPENFQNWIRPWNYDVLKSGLPKDSGAVIGLEIEVGVRCKHREDFEDVFLSTDKIIKKDAIMKYDSSIDYLDGSDKQHPNVFRGFEIVTRPMTFANMNAFVNNFCDNKHELLKSWEVETAGIHIHIAKKKIEKGREYSNLSKIEIGKLLVFMNKPLNRKFIKHVARRENPKYAKFKKKKLIDCKDMMDAIKIEQNACHYEALNITKPHTIEFRIFKGTTDKDILFSYIQFVQSLIEFVRVTSHQELVYHKYIKWLAQTNRSSYRQLKSYLRKFTTKEKVIITGGDS